MEFNEKLIEEGLNQVLIIAHERAQILEYLKQALLKENDEEVKFYASILCGLINDKGHRVS